MMPTTLQTRLVGGWEFPLPEVGNWGNNDLLRATVALRGIAALDGQEALYLSTYVDIDGRVLEGTGTYRLRFPPGGLPARGFWSLTLYEALPDGRCFLVGSSINRYSIGNRTVGLQENADGSMDILVQQRAPADAANCLPAPAGKFLLTLRAHLPDALLAQGRSPLPVVQRTGSATQ